MKIVTDKPTSGPGPAANEMIVATEPRNHKMNHKGNLAEFFAASPLRNSGLQIERTKDEPRRIDL
jgi:hypothetical protein